MNPIFRAAWEFEQFMSARHWEFCFIGGLAVQRWGKPRFTADADLTLMTGFGTEARFIEAILGSFSGRIPTARQFALDSRVLLVQASNDIPVDISLGALPFEAETVQRATLWKIDTTVALTICSAEDLIIHKCFANRQQDWLDVAGIIGKQQHRLDQALLLRELKPLAELKQSPQLVDRLKGMLP
ncbi:MAG: hypothetical protein ACE5JX_08420 [Acidobacteriota bacterium]